MFGAGAWRKSSVWRQVRCFAVGLSYRRQLVGSLTADQLSFRSFVALSPPILGWVSADAPNDSNYAVLKKNEKFYVSGFSNVNGIHFNCISSNRPIEDRHFALDYGTDGVLLGVLDGHSGWYCADVVSQRLPFYIASALLQTTAVEQMLKPISSHVDGVPKWPVKCFVSDAYKNVVESMRNGIGVPLTEKLRLAYEKLDDDISSEASSIDDDAMLPAISGCCSITVFLTEEKFYVANAGDCRAVLCQTQNHRLLHTLQISTDHDAWNPKEVTRIMSEHPGEALVLKRNRLLGCLEPLRCFGDVHYKWSLEKHRKLLQLLPKKRTRFPYDIYSTPPYLTASPEVSEHSPVGEGFIIIATDGLWEWINNEEAATIVCDAARLQMNTSTALIDAALRKAGIVDYNVILDKNVTTRHLFDDMSVLVVFLR